MEFTEKEKAAFLRIGAANRSLGYLGMCDRTTMMGLFGALRWLVEVGFTYTQWTGLLSMIVWTQLSGL